MNFEKIKTIIKTCTNFHIPNGKADIFIFSTARSGSTFLMELIQTQRGIKICDDPLNLRRERIRKAAGVKHWSDLLPNPERESKLKTYFEKIRRNRLPALNQSPLKRGHRWVTGRVVYKLLHGCEDIIPFFRETFHAEIIYLLRHPIAVTLSREEFPRLEAFLQNSGFCALFSREQLNLARRIISGGDRLERGLVSWCLENCPSLNNPDRKNWITLTYEDLVTRPERCVRFLCEKLNLPDPEKMLAVVPRPSATLYKSDEKTKAYFQERAVQEDRLWLIRKWKEKVSEAQEKRAFEILRAFDIDVYQPGEAMPSEAYLIKS